METPEQNPVEEQPNMALEICKVCAEQKRLEQTIEGVKLRLAELLSSNSDNLNTYTCSRVGCPE